jgi:hypothetical protein
MKGDAALVSMQALSSALWAGFAARRRIVFHVGS